MIYTFTKSKDCVITIDALVHSS